MRPIYLFEVLVIAMHSGRNLKVFLNKLPIWEYPLWCKQFYVVHSCRFVCLPASNWKLSIFFFL